jgi:hypothetical protein
MVRAILAGRKSQTRRVVKPVPLRFAELDRRNAAIDGFIAPFAAGESERPFAWRSPYGQPGQRVWVRETWACDSPRDNGEPHPDDLEGREQRIAPSLVHYRADRSGPEAARELVPGGSWRPSIFMPRWASRITLELTGVRIERLQDISDADARAEGWPGDVALQAPREWYAGLWDVLNAARGFGWDINPWVWTVGFRRV